MTTKTDIYALNVADSCARVAMLHRNATARREDVDMNSFLNELRNLKIEIENLEKSAEAENA